MAEQFTSCKQIFEAMPSRINQNAAKGLNAVYQFDLSGEGGGKWNVKLANGDCTVAEGQAESANVTFAMEARDYVNLINGDFMSQAPTLGNRMRIQGDMSLAIQMLTVFGLVPENATITCKQIFDLMPSRFNKSMAEGINAVYQFDLSGDGGGTWNVAIANGECIVREGQADSPGATISMLAQDYLDMVQGRLNAQAAFMSGKLRLSGDMNLAMRMQAIFQV
ncbi:MAG TPA: SCP2 sterol-binding domain-containing protein [Candidatus Binataceae bacterium]|nr:SCP2 sterol-binding domain-containing protein [Candidatus Binataceae bacterium]